ncbi:hypothetical protein Tco_0823192 [Tanacetum coccineum]|uniref:Uncharacterized protein n=1 Tax=Tanacetum coccineum TaxID=301880 RepID=A0ABQ5ALE0_9ASTR
MSSLNYGYGYAAPRDAAVEFEDFMRVRSCQDGGGLGIGRNRVVLKEGNVSSSNSQPTNNQPLAVLERLSQHMLNHSALDQNKIEAVCSLPKRPSHQVSRKLSQGNTIQANMVLKDTEFFNELVAAVMAGDSREVDGPGADQGRIVAGNPMVGQNDSNGSTSVEGGIQRGFASDATSAYI